MHPIREIVAKNVTQILRKAFPGKTCYGVNILRASYTFESSPTVVRGWLEGAIPAPKNLERLAKLGGIEVPDLFRGANGKA